MSETMPSPVDLKTNAVTSVDPQAVRIVEAVLFASSQPLSAQQLTELLPNGDEIQAILQDLQQQYQLRGVNLVQVAEGWMFRTAQDLSWILQQERVEERKLSKAALETLSIIAYHQPVTRAEIEDIRGVSVSKGTLDLLLEAGWIRMRGRRRTPGRPLTFGTTQDFLSHFSLDSISDLPGFADLKGAGLLDLNLSASIDIPLPSDDPELHANEDPLDEEDIDDEGEVA